MKVDLNTFDIHDTNVEQKFADLDRKIDVDRKVNIHNRSERAQNLRQGLILLLFAYALLVMCCSLTYSAYILFTVESGFKHEAAVKVFEIFGVGILAGFIGFAFTKTFEK